MRRTALLALGLTVAALASTARAGERLTYLDLIGRLTDLERLAVVPPAGQTCQQWSSYDRGSRYDEAAKKYVGWSANGDGTGIIRREDGREVFAEMDGPGVVWRIWSASAGAGHVRIFLDGAEEPAVDLAFRGYFDRKNEPFTGKALCYMAARGLNAYVPIPYQKSCKIVADKGWGRYFHFTYTTYPKGTELPTFTRKLSPEESAALKKANAFLETCGSDPAGKRAGETRETLTAAPEPGQAAKVLELAGPRAITALRVKLDLPEQPDDFAPLRELCLRITWDGEAQPAVWSPLGDFFGTAPGVNQYASLPLGMTDDGFYSYWYMPFAKSALVELVNDGTQKRSVALEIVHAPLARPAESLGRFHAKWHRDAFLPAEPERRAIDWTMLKTAGRGRFVGVMLHVWNPRGGWWGEGDEKFFVDGEKFPSTIGTGSEDYFGYAWCTPRLFYQCYHNQTHNTGGNRGHISVNRWQITDDVPFQTSFEAAIEKYYPNRKPTLYAAVAYWYLAPGGTDGYAPVPLADRLEYCKPIALPRVKGAIEGERLKILERTGGGARPQDLHTFGDGWSGIEHLWWTHGKPGDKLTVAVPVKAAGKHKVTLQLTKARDYAIVQLHFNGKKIGEPIDLYNPSVIPSGVIDLGVHDLAKGQSRLTIEIVGANPKADKAYMAGLDYVKLDPAP